MHLHDLFYFILKPFEELTQKWLRTNHLTCCAITGAKLDVRHSPPNYHWCVFSLAICLLYLVSRPSHRQTSKRNNRFLGAFPYEHLNEALHSRTRQAPEVKFSSTICFTIERRTPRQHCARLCQRMATDGGDNPREMTRHQTSTIL